MKDFRLGLQLFADDDDSTVDSEGYTGKGEEEEEEFVDIEEDEDETLDEESDESDDDESPDDEGKPKKELTKAEKAIIKYKQQAKELKQKLQEKEDKEMEQQLALEESKRINQLTKQGVSEEEAKTKAKDESEVKRLRLKLTAMELDKLEDKYAGISAYARQLSKDKEKFPDFSLEQLYLANYAKSSSFDEKTRLEQEILHSKKTAKSKSLDVEGGKQRETIKMSQSDMRAYNHMKQTRPNLTKKQFMSILYGDLE